MAQNLWTNEILKEAIMVPSATSGNARWIQRNGEWSMELRPNVFYKSSVYGKLMDGYFEENTQYCFDLWIDPDEYGAAGYTGNANGIRVIYSGSSSGNSGNALLARAVSGSVVGWTHMKWISPVNTTVTEVNVYYSRAYNWYARWDSSVSEVEEIEFNKNGIASTGQWKENSEKLQPTKGGIVSSFNLVEY